MICFNHADRAAVGICKSCQRGLCHECAFDLGKGLACKARCEGDVQQLIDLIEQNARYRNTSDFVMAGVRRNRIVASSFYILMGAAFIAWGLSRPFMRFVAVLGTLFVVYGLYFLTRLPKTPTVPSTDASKNHP